MTPRRSDEHLIQSLWGGYGRLIRRHDQSGSIVVKDIRWPTGQDDPSHRRKLRSYQVEVEWYSRWIAKVPPGCRVPACLSAESRKDGFRLELEDLDAVGYPRRAARLERQDLSAAIAWLARFHAAFLGCAPTGLWKEGSYWHLSTRSEELRAMPPGPLRDAARELDRRLAQARFRTLVHGDAKPDNFCLGTPGKVAVVDFQYVGGGCGMRDLAYLLDCVHDSALTDQVVEAALSEYFAEFHMSLDAGHPSGEEVEAEWRALFPVAWLDFQRFLQGWSPAYARPCAALARRIERELKRLDLLP